MIDDQTRARDALKSIDRFTSPSPIFIGESAKKLYAAEERRTKAIGDCAKEWADVVGVDRKEYWTRSIPQVLFDTLHNYETGAALLAAEEFLKRCGYSVTRPE
jgi:hypothetical protein